MWPRTGTSTYKELYNIYCNYVAYHYGKPTIVFDVYDDLTTKSMAQPRRAGNKVGADVTFTEDIKVTMKKQVFLSNSYKKKMLIAMRGECLQKRGCRVLQANGDADLVIVKTAVESSQTKKTVYVGDNTDLIVLLCHYAKSQNHDLIFRPDPKPRSKQQVWEMKKVKPRAG